MTNIKMDNASLLPPTEQQRMGAVILHPEVGRSCWKVESGYEVPCGAGQFLIHQVVRIRIFVLNHKSEVSINPDPMSPLVGCCLSS